MFSSSIKQKKTHTHQILKLAKQEAEAAGIRYTFSVATKLIVDAPKHFWR